MTTSPADSAEPILYMNGDYLPLSAARISPLDQGFLLGDGIFDVVSAWQGVILNWKNTSTASLIRCGQHGWKHA